MLAEALQRWTPRHGPELDKIIRATGARPASHVRARSRPFDADRNFLVAEGERMSYRRWGDLVAENGFNVERARKFVREEADS